MKAHGLKIVVSGKTREDLVSQLRKLAVEVGGGYDHMNVSDGDGTRMMRPLKAGEETFFLDVRDLP